jgi:hypothetical protein
MNDTSQTLLVTEITAPLTETPTLQEMPTTDSTTILHCWNMAYSQMSCLMRRVSQAVQKLGSPRVMICKPQSQHRSLHISILTHKYHKVYIP